MKLVLRMSEILVEDSKTGGPSSIYVRMDIYLVFNSDIVNSVWNTRGEAESIILLIFVFWECIILLIFFSFRLCRSKDNVPE